MRIAEDRGTGNPGRPDLLEIFSKPGAEWTDAEVIACLQWLLTRELSYLLSFILRHLGPLAGVEDAREVWSSFSASSLLRVIRTYDPGRGRGFRSYFLFCLKKRCLRYARHLAETRGREQPLGGSIGSTESLEFQIADLGQDDNAASLVELRDLLEKALARIKPVHAMAMVDHYVRGKPIAQIATERRVAPGTVKAWLHRGRQELRMELKSLGYVR